MKNLSYNNPNDSTTFARGQYDYSYPYDLDLDPTSEQHSELLAMIRERVQSSYDEMSKRYQRWNDIDRMLRVYAEPEELKKANEEDSTNPNNAQRAKTKYVIPVTYSILETLLTYMSNAFLKDPIFSFHGVGPEDQLGAAMMQELINYQMRKTSGGLALHTQWRDSFAYGIGVISPVWSERYGYVAKKRNVFDNILSKLTEKASFQKGRIYEGNELMNIDPFSFFPDPSVPAHKVQDGEFVSWYESTTIQNLLEAEQYKRGDYFNVKYLEDLQNYSVMSANSTERRDAKEVANGSGKSNHRDILWFYVRLIPAAWGLGKSQRQERWLFCVGADSVIIQAKKVEFHHGQFPVVVTAPNYDGYTTAPTSHLEVAHDMQDLVNFFYSSHVANIRKTINDMIVVDPSLVNIYDLANPAPGKIIRMRRGAWGKSSIDQAIKQLDIKDITARNIEEASYLSQTMRQTLGANESLSGLLQERTSRVSANESQGIRSSGLARLERIAMIISMQSMQPLGEMLAYHTQQFLSEPAFVSLASGIEKSMQENHKVQTQNGRMKIRPIDLAVNLDVLPGDGTIPGREDANVWIQLYQILGQNPALAAQFDMGSIFKHIAKQMGAKNVDNFVIMDDAEVQKNIQRGNLVPAGQKPAL